MTHSVEPVMAFCADGCQRAVEAEDIRKVSIPGSQDAEQWTLCSECADHIAPRPAPAVRECVNCTRPAYKNGLECLRCWAERKL